jgi:TatD DNase family protein
MLVDSHCHLDFSDFAGEIGGVLARAKAADVGLMLSVGTQLSKADAALALAERYPQVYATVGVHPHHVTEEGAVTVEDLMARAAHPRVVGIGESGLDFFYDFSPRAEQEASFRLHIEAARRLGLPLVIHSRDADADMLRILHDEMANGRFHALMHCFSSSRRLAEEALDLGLYISASGVITFNRSEDLRHIFRDVPLDRLLVETDSPYLAPVPLRGHRNEPANVVHTARVLASVKGIGMEEIARITTANFLRLFSRVVPPAAATENPA